MADTDRDAYRCAVRPTAPCAASARPRHDHPSGGSSRMDSAAAAMVLTSGPGRKVKGWKRPTQLAWSRRANPAGITPAAPRAASSSLSACPIRPTRRKMACAARPLAGLGFPTSFMPAKIAGMSRRFHAFCHLAARPTMQPGLGRFLIPERVTCVSYRAAVLRSTSVRKPATRARLPHGVNVR